MKKIHFIYIGISIIAGLGLGYLHALIMAPSTDLEANTTINFNIAEDPMLGKEDTLITIIEFSDYQCKSCKDFYTNSFHGLIEEYVNKGKANYTFIDFPLETNPQSIQASLAANCAQEQERYWEMHNLLFQKQQKWSNNEKYEKEVFKIAVQAGIKDMEKFKNCYRSKKYDKEISKDLEEGIKKGVKLVPTFLINGQKIVGNQNILTLKTIINKELAILEPIGPHKPPTAESIGPPKPPEPIIHEPMGPPEPPEPVIIEPMGPPEPEPVILEPMGPPATTE